MSPKGGLQPFQGVRHDAQDRGCDQEGPDSCGPIVAAHTVQFLQKGIVYRIHAPAKIPNIGADFVHTGLDVIDIRFEFSNFRFHTSLRDNG
jgi:hypothetical protein